MTGRVVGSADGGRPVRRYMTGAEHIELMKVDAEMRAALTNATKERGRRREWVDTERGPELAWVVYERHVMAVLTNRHRTSRGLGSVGVDRVLAVERRGAAWSGVPRATSTM